MIDNATSSYNDRLTEIEGVDDDEENVLDDVDIDEDDYHLHLRDKQMKKRLKFKKTH